MKYIWQLPQTIIALKLLLFFKYEKSTYKGKRVYIAPKFPGCISLGEFIILNRFSVQTVKHEYGHSVQSEMLGPLYLLVIGLPSLFFNLLTRAKILKPESYYSRFPENQADILGEVER